MEELTCDELNALLRFLPVSSLLLFSLLYDKHSDLDGYTYTSDCQSAYHWFVARILGGEGRFTTPGKADYH